jgi:caffeoyl-CoA O-methyltransferase
MAKFNPPSRPADLEIVAPAVEKYLYDLIPPRDAVLAEMEARAEKEGIPIVGPLVGRMFHLLATMVGAKRVMELGSAIGYSTIWWARAVGAGGRVFYTDGDPRKAGEAKAYVERAGVADRVDLLVGDAVESMNTAVDGPFDVVFCDIDKHGYPAAFRAALPRIRPGGLFVCDNTIWSGRVVSEAAKDDRNTLGVQELNRLVYESKEIYPVILPLRDGVTVAVKR